MPFNLGVLETPPVLKDRKGIFQLNLLNRSLALSFVPTNVGAAISRPNYRHDNSVGFIENICKIETFRAANSRPYSESFSMEQLDKREFEDQKL